MRVEQLIRALQAMPLDAPVLIECAEGGACDIARPRLRRASLHHAFACDGGPHRFDEDGSVDAVHLGPGPSEPPLVIESAKENERESADPPIW